MKKNNFRIIEINSFRGLCFAIFVVLGLIAGFVISPGWVCMNVWNYFAEDLGTLRLMELYHGIMLWLIIALSIYALNKKQSIVISTHSFNSLTPEQIKEIAKRAQERNKHVFEELETISTTNITETKQEHENKEERINK